MAGGFDNAIVLGKSDLDALGIEVRTGLVALDLGAGFRIHPFRLHVQAVPSRPSTVRPFCWMNFAPAPTAFDPPD
jgi:hypothetical protein